MFGFGFVRVSAMFVCFENALLVNGFKGSDKWVVICLEILFYKKVGFRKNLDFFFQKVKKKHEKVKSDLKLKISWDSNPVFLKVT
jgi:hypothetical protein